MDEKGSEFIYACLISQRFSETEKSASVAFLISSTENSGACSIKVSPFSGQTSNTALKKINQKMNRKKKKKHNKPYQ